MYKNSAPVACSGAQNLFLQNHGRANRLVTESKRTQAIQTAITSSALSIGPAAMRLKTLTCTWSAVPEWPESETGGAAAPKHSMSRTAQAISSGALWEKLSSCGGKGDLNSDWSVPAPPWSMRSERSCARRMASRLSDGACFAESIACRARWLDVP